MIKLLESIDVALPGLTCPTFTLDAEVTFIPDDGGTHVYSAEIRYLTVLMQGEADRDALTAAYPRTADLIQALERAAMRSREVLAEAERIHEATVEHEPEPEPPAMGLGVVNGQFR